MVRLDFATSTARRSVVMRDGTQKNKTKRERGGVASRIQRRQSDITSVYRVVTAGEYSCCLLDLETFPGVVSRVVGRVY